MNTKTKFVLSIILGLLFFAPWQFAAAQDPANQSESTTNSAVDAKTMEVLRSMSQFLDQQPRLHFTVTDVIEHEDEDKIMVQYTHERELFVERPTHLRVDVKGDLERQSVLYDGVKLSVYLPEDSIYAEEAAPGTINETMEMLSNKHGIRRPVGDLAYTGLADRILGNVSKGKYLGIHTALGVPCHHLAFTAENIDWQLWIDAGEHPVPRKLAIHYWAFEGQPRYMMEVKGVEIPESFPEDLFDLDLPDDVEKVPFEPVKGKIVRRPEQ